MIWLINKYLGKKSPNRHRETFIVISVLRGPNNVKIGTAKDIKKYFLSYQRISNPMLK